MSVVKITFSADESFRNTLNQIKENYDFNSISSLIVQAVNEFKYKKDLEKWHLQTKEADLDKDITKSYEDLEIGEIE